MARHFLVHLVWFVLTVSRLTQATRFLPMVVWDHLNPLLTCRCNWLTVPEIDVFDQFDFVCPTTDLNAILLDGITRQEDNMNANIFKRKFTGTWKELSENLSNGTFCNRTASVKVGTCKNGGKEGKKFTEKIVPADGYTQGDIYVYFNNVVDGKESSLSNDVSSCKMVFVVNVTYQRGVVHDMAYGKCFSPPDIGDKSCTNIKPNCISSCGVAEHFQTTIQPPKPTTEITEVPTTKSTNYSQSTDHHETQPSITPSKQVCPEICKNIYNASKSGVYNSTQPCTGESVGSASKFNGKYFGYGIVVGFVCGCLIVGLFVLVIRSTKKGQKWTPYPRAKMSKARPCVGRINADQSSQHCDDAKDTPNVTSKDGGFSNRQFPLRPVSQEDEKVSFEPNATINCNGLINDIPATLPPLSVQRHNSLPPIKRRLPPVEISGQNSTVIANIKCDQPDQNTTQCTYENTS